MRRIIESTCRSFDFLHLLTLKVCIILLHLVSYACFLYWSNNFFNFLQPKWNDALLEMFRIDYVGSSPYITCNPSLFHHRLSTRDRFLILSSDGLYQYFTNEEAVAQVEMFIATTPEGDPAQHLVEEVLFRAANKAGMLKSYRVFFCSHRAVPFELLEGQAELARIGHWSYFSHALCCRYGFPRIDRDTTRWSSSIPRWCICDCNIFGG